MEIINWKLIRYCWDCGKGYEQNLESYFYYQAISEREKDIVIPHGMLTQRWSCSDCLLGFSKGQPREIKEQQQ